MARIKVCYLITKGNWGGAQRYVYDLATALPRDTYEPVVVVGHGEALVTKLQEQNIKTIRLEQLKRDISLISEIKTFWKLIKLLRQLKPDVLHLNSSKSGLGALAGRIVGIKKIIFTAHGWAFAESRPGWQKLLIKFFSWLTIILSHHTIAVSETDRNLVKDWWFCRNKVQTIWNGIGPINFLPRNKTGAEVTIGTIAELHANKNLDSLIRAFSLVTKNYPDARLVIIGEGEERAKLEKLISELNLENKIKLAGYQENASRSLLSFDIAVLPSKKEGLPYFILEAGLAGLAVVASNVGGIPEIIENSQTGLLWPLNGPQSLADLLSSLIADSKKRAVLGQNLKTRVEKLFTVDAMVEKTLDLYTN